ncbi:MAG: rod-binding protein [Caulobacterales bacterium]|nr:rod-binding protein [Caulobacterales bacterium]
MPADILMGQAQSTAGSTAELARRRKIEEAARAFEASFLSTMLQPMFEGLSTEAPFGGGQGEAMFKSFLTDAIAKQTAKRGGLGVADTVQREMLKLQALS